MNKEFFFEHVFSHMSFRPFTTDDYSNWCGYVRSQFPMIGKTADYTVIVDGSRILVLDYTFGEILYTNLSNDNIEEFGEVPFLRVREEK